MSNVINQAAVADNLQWLLLRAFLVCKQELVRLSEDYDLSVMQTYTLCLMEPEKEVAMNSLSTLLNCDASNVTGIVDRLVSSAYVDREECDRDRRIKMITLTQAGLQVRNRILQNMQRMQVPDLSALSDEEKTSLRNILQKMLSSAQ